MRGPRGWVLAECGPRGDVLLAVLGLWCGETRSGRALGISLVAIRGGGLLPPVKLAVSPPLRCSSGGADAARRSAADLGRRTKERGAAEEGGGVAGSGGPTGNVEKAKLRVW